MQGRYVGQIEPDMEVCDVGGDKVGTIARVYRHADAAAGASAPAPGVPSGRDEVMEVRTGVLGLGAHLFIPLSAIQETLDGRVFVARPKEEFEGLGWRAKPAYLDELT